MSVAGATAQTLAGLGELGELRLLLWPRSKLAAATPGARLEIFEEHVYTDAAQGVLRQAIALEEPGLRDLVLRWAALLQLPLAVRTRAHA